MHIVLNSLLLYYVQPHDGHKKGRSCKYIYIVVVMTN